MNNYVPPFEITDEMLLLVSSISEKVGMLVAIGGLDAKPHLRRNNQIKSIHASLRIEANSLSLNQVRDVINGKAVLGDRREILEVKNAIDTYGELGTIDPYDLEDLLRVHGMMVCGIEDEAGQFRSGEEGVFDSETGRCIFVAPPARFVPELMQDLFRWIGDSRDTVHPLILSNVFHYEFVFIHPFSDGNGRMARLWQTALLRAWHPVFEYIPIENQIQKFQQEYYHAIEICHSSGNSTAFIVFMLDQIDKTLEDVISSIGDSTFASKQVKALLAVMDYSVSYSSAELLERLNLKSRDGLRIHYLKPAMEAGLIGMTNPDKPRSKNQRYFKK